MTAFLPPNLLALFAPRDPIPFLPPPSALPHEKKAVPPTGLAGLVNLFEDPSETPPPVKAETRDERRERRKKERQEMIAYKLEQEIAMWDPATETTDTDPFKTLFVGRINYDTSESKLRREFEVYGPIRKITLVTNVKTGKPRGYAFIEFEHERDMHAAYKHADGRKIDGRRVLVDVERGRTVKGWLPRRLGGGLGGTRRGGPDVNVKVSGRDDGRNRNIAEYRGPPRDMERERRIGNVTEKGDQIVPVRDLRVVTGNVTVTGSVKGDAAVVEIVIALVATENVTGRRYHDLKRKRKKAQSNENPDTRIQMEVMEINDWLIF
ncbi:unnamed protein product [Cyprideis torosa]|uniref:U1 small nuclear ribonucleoprotein 70 kDa n=1 Tax=Cyprideis torosa TaxID=163714 RepID=A0A7R8WEA5_9CRUS|nr:unnamed protein product [Cyprideis torosa]CAG0892648.1 unnamed protein product [Cyprideis torosa]